MKKTKKKQLLARPLASHPVSRFVRSILEQNKLRKTLVMQGVAILTLARVVTYPTRAFDYSVLANPELDSFRIEKVTTETTFTFPVSKPSGVSQGYHSFHRAIDIRAPKGTSVLAVEKGVVVEIGHLKNGYGESIRIAHEGTMASLYAHLSKIEVTVGQKVSKGQEIGTVGTTGWATGPHLHFEMAEGRKIIDPGVWL